MTNNRGGQEKIRKTRSDKKVRFTLRLDQKTNDYLDSIAFNHSTSKQKIIALILPLALSDERVREKLFRYLKPRKYPYIITQ